MPNYESLIALHMYKLETREQFDARPADTVPEGLRERVAKYPGAFVLWDPEDDEQGYCVVGDDRAAMAKELCEQRELTGE